MMRCAACGYEYSRRWNMDTTKCDKIGDQRFGELTPSMAVARAEEMRKAKIASLKKQIERLQALRFEE